MTIKSTSLVYFMNIHEIQSIFGGQLPQSRNKEGEPLKKSEYRLRKNSADIAMVSKFTRW